jgi:hypothetical protein
MIVPEALTAPEALTVLVILVALSGEPVSEQMTDQASKNWLEAAQRARPGHIAELEELEAARRSGTRAAYDLFLERHPQSRYAPQARSERMKLTR